MISVFILLLKGSYLIIFGCSSFYIFLVKKIQNCSQLPISQSPSTLFTVDFLRKTVMFFFVYFHAFYDYLNICSDFYKFKASATLQLKLNNSF